MRTATSIVIAVVVLAFAATANNCPNVQNDGFGSSFNNCTTCLSSLCSCFGLAYLPIPQQCNFTVSSIISCSDAAACATSWKNCALSNSVNAANATGSTCDSWGNVLYTQLVANAASPNGVAFDSLQASCNASVCNIYSYTNESENGCTPPYADICSSFSGATSRAISIALVVIASLIAAVVGL